MYKVLKGKIITDVEGQYFEIKRGVRQEDPIITHSFQQCFGRDFQGIKVGK